MIALVPTKRRLQGVKLEGQVLEGLDLSHMRGFGSKWEHMTFRSCNLDLSEMGNVTWHGCRFEKCSVQLAAMGPARYENVVFDCCDLKNTSFQGAWMSTAQFLDCRMQYVNFLDAQLEDVRFESCNLRWAALSVVSADRVSYDGSNLWGARVTLDCHFFHSSFDDKWRRRFAGLLAWAWPEAEAEKDLLKKISGQHFAAVERLMTGGEK